VVHSAPVLNCVTEMRRHAYRALAAIDRGPLRRAMRELFFVPVAALLCFSFGCGVLEDDVDASESASAETYATPFADSAYANPSNTGEPLESASERGAVAHASASLAAFLPGAPAAETPPGEDELPGQNAPPPAEEPPPAPAQPDPGPAPATTCTVQKDADGFFWRSSPKSAYVAYVPASYSPSKPMRVIVGMHGCGDTALNFAKWGVNPFQTRSSQEHIGISVSGESGNNKCWSMGVDDDKVLAAVDDLAKCFWVNRSKVVVAGYSSGGQLAYRVGMTKASSFAGILVENSGLHAAGSPSASLIAGASWKIHVAHRARTSDSVFPIAKVKADWQAMSAAGLPIVTSELAGGHDGKSEDWADWLIPQSASWVRK